MNAQKRSPATLAEYLKSAEDGTWLPEQTAFVLRHVEQVEAAYRQLLSGKAARKQRSEVRRNPAMEVKLCQR